MAQDKLTFLLDKYAADEKALRKIDEYVITKLPRLLSIFLKKEIPSLTFLKSLPPTMKAPDNCKTR